MQLLDDTSADIQRLRAARLRDLPSWRKIEMFTSLCASAYRLAEVGYRERHPDATSVDIERHFATARLGPELTEKLFRLRDERANASRSV